MYFYVAKDFSESEKEINFAEFENDVFRAFKKLFDVFQTEACRATVAAHFPAIKRLCILSANEQFKPYIKKVGTMESLLDLLAESKLHCNWIKTGFLEAIASRSKTLDDLLKSYEEVFFSKKLSEIWDYLPLQHIRNRYYERLKAVFIKKDPDNTTLREIKEYSRFSLSTDLDDFIVEFCHNCLSITWLVPTDKVYQYFLSALTIPQKSRKEDFLQIGAWVVHHPQSVLQKLKVELGK